MLSDVRSGVKSVGKVVENDDDDDPMVGFVVDGRWVATLLCRHDASGSWL